MGLRIKYIGSKHTLMDRLVRLFAQHIPPGSVVADLFSGTGVVAARVHTQFGATVVTNDLQLYAHVLSRARVTRFSAADVRLIDAKVAEYNGLPGVEGFVAREFAPPRRKYFSAENARMIDAARTRLEADRAALPERVYVYLLASVIAAADRVSNVPTMYGAYLKGWLPRALKPFRLDPYEPNGVTHGRNRALQGDTLEVAARVRADVAYLDPPYNSRQYCASYHVLETIARYDNPVAAGVTGRRDTSQQRSPFCSVPKAQGAFELLVDRLRHVKTLLVSYSEDGIVPLDRMKQILGARGARRVTMHSMTHKRLQTSDAAANKTVMEVLFVATQAA